jgi:DNA-binding response OmpR family regulator
MDQKRHILIVDDDVDLANLLAQAVNDDSDAYDVKVARDVDGAMVQVQRAQTAQQPFDLVITDIKMLGLSGLELLEALATIAPATKTITMTAYTSPELAERAHQLNVFAYLTKPFVLSEFRQIVRSALFPTAAETQPETEPSTEVSAAQQVAIGDQLATLRVMTGTTIAFLMRADGTVLAADSLQADMDIAELCAALVGAQRTVAEEMGRAFGQACTIRQNYYGTETHSICCYRLDDNYAIAVVFGPAVKEGQVWYYVREAAKQVQRVLNIESGEPTPKGSARAGNVFDMLDHYFPEGKRTRTPTRRASSSQPTIVAEATPVQLQEAPTLAGPPTPVQDATVAELPLLKEIDWNAPSDLTWDQIVADTDQGFSGLTLEQAQQQGLVGTEILQGQQLTPGHEPVPAPLPVDDIDWDAPVDLNWDDIASQTDQGFAGLSLEEAKKRGLIGEL